MRVESDATHRGGGRHLKHEDPEAVHKIFRLPLDLERPFVCDESDGL